MKAWVVDRYGPPEVLRLEERPVPVPGKGELLLRVLTTSVNSADWRIRSGIMPRGFGVLAPLIFGFGKPRQPVLGNSCVGVVEAIGAGAEHFALGDRVLAVTGMRMGTHAEYCCVSAQGAVVLLPDSISDEDAAALPFGGTAALDFFRRGTLQRGEQVLINGAAGAVGSAAVQLARLAGARVTAVCGPDNVSVMRTLGADDVIDYTREDFTHGSARYDLIMDVVGTAPYARCRPVLRDGGRLLQVLATVPDMLRAPWIALTSTHRAVVGPATERRDDLQTLVDMLERGEFRPLIGTHLPFAAMVEAHRLVDSGHKRGNLVLRVAS